MEYPKEPEVGVGSIILENNKILLIRRLNPPGKGKWSVPGGHLKLGESIYDAAVRELREETGIDGDPIGIINIDEYVEYDDKRVKYHYVLIDVLIKPKTSIKHAKPDSDVSEIKICTLKDALNLNLTLSTRSLITKLIKEKKLLHTNYIVLHK